VRALVLAGLAVVVAAGALLFLSRTQDRLADIRRTKHGVVRTDPAPKLAPDDARVGDAAVLAPDLAPATIRGRVLAGGKPAGGITVSMNDQLGESISDADGAYELTVARPGPVVVVADDRKTGRRGDRVVEVEAGAELGGIDLELRPTAQLAITVTDADGKPVAGALVGVWGRGATASYFPRPTSATDERGTIERYGLVVGPVTVSAQAGHMPPVLAKASILSAEARVAVNLVIPLSGGRRLAGVVRDDRGAALAQAIVQLGPGGTRAITDRGGRFAFDRLAEGTYTLIASREGAADQAVSVDLDAGTTDAVIVVPRPGALDLTLRGFGGADVDVEPLDVPTAGGIVAIYATDNTPRTVALEPGTYRIVAASGTAVGSTKISIRPGETTKVALAPSPPISVKGRALRFPDRAPIANLVCRAGRSSAKTDAHGAFLLDRLPAGELRVACEDPALGVATRGDAALTAAAGQAVELQVDIVVAAPGDLGGADRLGARLERTPDKTSRMFTSIEPSGPAQEAGIGEGDVFVTVEGRPATGRDAETAVTYLSSRPAGRPVAVGVRPKSGSYVVDLTITPR
jgi:hypothetical protein